MNAIFERMLWAETPGQRFFRITYLIVGLAFGSLYLYLTIIVGGLTLGNDEPLLIWAFIIGGPLLTLPAVIGALFFPRVAGTCLIVGAMVSFFAMQALVVRLYVSLPMTALGIGAFFLGKGGSRLLKRAGQQGRREAGD